MTRRRIVVLLSLLAFTGLVYWIASHTYWADVEVPMPPRGEARTNQTYAAQRFVEKVGGHATRDLTLSLPPATSVIVLSAWTWDLSPARREALERWVESGGRLVIDNSVTTDDEFERWSGLGYHYQGTDDDKDTSDTKVPCRRFHEERADGLVSPTDTHWLCDFDIAFSLTSGRPAEWTLTDPNVGVQVARVRIGRGTVTTVNGNPFRQRRLFDGDHGWLLVKTADLRRGDDVHFLSEGDYPSLLALIWQRGQPVVVLGLALIVFLLWRGAVRFGPLAATTSAARRSLAEQIRGTGEFALQHGGSESLHAACVRALDEAARRRVAGYSHLPNKARADAVARLVGLDAKTLAAAICPRPTRRSHELRSTVALIETARRRLLLNKARSSHAN